MCACKYVCVGGGGGGGGRGVVNARACLSACMREKEID